MARGERAVDGVDYRALFRTLPAPAVLVTDDLQVLDATDAFCALVGHPVEALLDQSFVTVLPGGPAVAPAITALANAVAAAARTGAVQRTADVRVEPAPGGAAAWWRCTVLPTGAAPGEALVVTVEVVTDVVQERARARQLGRAEAAAARRLQGLAFVALEIAGAETVAELTDIVVTRGVSALGCDSGGIAVRDDDEGVVRLSITESAATDAESQRLFQIMPMDMRVPSVVAAVVPEPIFLGSRAEGLAWGPQMQRVYETAHRDAWASLPLRADGRLLGSLTVSWVEERDITGEERALLAAFAAQCAQALRHIQTRQAERRALMSSRLLSETLQRSLLSEPPPLDDAELAVRYVPALQEAYVGGDWYDAFHAPGGGTLVAIGDVAGHDRVATAAMAQIRNLLRGIAHSLEETPAVVLTALDLAMADLPVEAMATAVLAHVEPLGDGAGLRLVWTNAGHPPPVLLLPDGSTQLLTAAPELLLGVEAGTYRTDHELVVPPGATVLLYTDGLVERRGESLTQSTDWLLRRLRSMAHLPVEALCDALLAELPGQGEDDVAILALRAVGARPRATGPAVGGDARGAPAGAPGLGVVPPPAPTSASAHEAALVLAPDVASVGRARTFVRHHCKLANVSADTTDTVTLLTSETVTNAFTHGRSEARLRLQVRPGHVRVEVGDDNSRHPVRSRRDDDALDGRGLDIVGLLSARWGVDDDEVGKTVWFEVEDQPAG